MRRRSFLQQSGGAAAARFAWGANDTIRIAVLGCQKLLRVQVAILCDPDRRVTARRAAEFEKLYGRPVRTETDLRRIFRNRQIDAVSIATPNHWHAPATIWACQAGKDLYLETPGCHNIFEGRKM